MTKDLYTSLIATLLFALILCGLYPLLIWCSGQLLFPRSANGSLLVNATSGKVLGCELIGQNFTAEKYFHPRPSAAGNGYDATSSSGSNLGPTSQKLMDAIKARVETYRTENKLPNSALIPSDAVTASGSGLDPHISVQNALLQTSRIAQARKMNPDVLKKEITKATIKPFLNILGEPCVNVLQLNLAMDGLPINGD